MFCPRHIKCPFFASCASTSATRRFASAEVHDALPLQGLSPVCTSVSREIGNAQLSRFSRSWQECMADCGSRLPAPPEKWYYWKLVNHKLGWGQGTKPTANPLASSQQYNFDRTPIIMRNPMKIYVQLRHQLDQQASSHANNYARSQLRDYEPTSRLILSRHRGLTRTNPLSTRALRPFGWSPIRQRYRI